MRVLFLILASDGGVYDALQKVWRSYIHTFRPTVEAYLYKADPRLPTEAEFRDDVLWVRCPNNLASVAQKFKMALAAVAGRLDEFDYICRPNLSSFFVVDRYLKALEGLPTTWACLAKEHRHPAIFPTGAGFTITPDVARAILASPFPQRVPGGDDVAVGAVLQELGIKITDAARVDITAPAHWDHRLATVFATPTIFHVRVKHETADREALDLAVHRRLLEHFYPHVKQEWKEVEPHA